MRNSLARWFIWLQDAAGGVYGRNRDLSNSGRHSANWDFRWHFTSNHCMATAAIRYVSYVYWTVHHLDSWIKVDQLDVTCFIISLSTAQHVSNVSISIFRSLLLIVDLFHVLYCSGSMKMDVLTFETCWAVNNEIIKQVTSSWSIFIQIRYVLSFFHGANASCGPWLPLYRSFTITLRHISLGRTSLDEWSLRDLYLTA